MITIAGVLVAVAHASNEPEAAVIRAQLTEAHIPSVTKGPRTPQLGASGACAIYVEDRLAEQALAILATPEFSDEELARLSDEAGREYDI
ncbi:MAG: hypothetical protein ABSC56_05760 [Solirubrobacteraceae bacterium]